MIVSLLAAGACSRAPDVTLRFATLQNAPDLEGATLVELTASRDERRVAYERKPYAPGVSLGLDANVDGPGLTLRVIISDADDGPDPIVLAYAVADPSVTDTIDDAADDCCITMCLCAPSVHAAAACNCGSTTCEAC